MVFRFFVIQYAYIRRSTEIKTFFSENQYNKVSLLTPFGLCKRVHKVSFWRFLSNLILFIRILPVSDLFM